VYGFVVHQNKIQNKNQKKNMQSPVAKTHSKVYGFFRQSKIPCKSDVWICCPSKQKSNQKYAEGYVFSLKNAKLCRFIFH
jgi:hypothetical protein